MKSIPQHTLDYIDRWLELRFKWDDIPGYVVAIAKDDKVLLNKAYGFAHKETKEKLTTDHIFRIASHSKTFTATSIMQLQEKGKLRIDDPVVDYLPWLKEHSDKRWGDVTIRQLLSHSAGIIRDGTDANFWLLTRDFPNKDELHTTIMETELIIEPNTRLKYSNYGYALLGELIETVSGISYGQYMAENIISPLGLEHTYPEIQDDMRSQLSTGYTRRNLKRERLAFPHCSTGVMAAATGFCSTTSDLCTYFLAHRVGSGKLLSDASKKEMQRLQWHFPGEKRGYGLGLNLDTMSKRKVFGHGGGFPGFVTKSCIDPKDGVVVSVLTNCHGAQPEAMVKAVYELLDEFGEKEPKEEHLKYEVRYSDYYGAGEIIATEDGLRMISPNSWDPLYHVDKLSIVDDDMLKIEEAKGSDSFGEMIKYIRNSDGTIKSIVDAGLECFPSDDGDLVPVWKK